MRAVFDYCDKTIRTEHNTSLLEIMFDQTEGLGTLRMVILRFSMLSNVHFQRFGQVLEYRPDVVVSSKIWCYGSSQFGWCIDHWKMGCDLAVNRGRLAKSTSETDGIKVVQRWLRISDTINCNG